MLLRKGDHVPISVTLDDLDGFQKLADREIEICERKIKPACLRGKAQRIFAVGGQEFQAGQLLDRLPVTAEAALQRIAEQLETGKLLEAETGDLDPVDGLDEAVIIDHHAAEEGQLRLPDKRGARQQEKGSFREDRPFEAAQVAFLHKTANTPTAVIKAEGRFRS